eukprot:6505859-Prymnesium_polylepis.1
MTTHEDGQVGAHVLVVYRRQAAIRAAERTEEDCVRLCVAVDGQPMQHRTHPPDVRGRVGHQRALQRCGQRALLAARRRVPCG